jgi:predicted flap endonuclease-1-like 5' DNA nuclease
MRSRVPGPTTARSTPSRAPGAAGRTLAFIDRLRIDSLRAEITLFEAARAFAAADGRSETCPQDLVEVAPLALRLRRSSFMNEYFASQQAEETELEHEAAVAAGHVIGSETAVPAGPSDDLERLKGVGPKLAGMLIARGLGRYDQIAKLSDAELERLDEDLGAFRGRLQRDRVVEQADYLARGDIDGFEQRFGKL